MSKTLLLLQVPPLIRVTDRLTVLDLLYNLGCHICQGFLYARPMPAAQVVQWLHDTQTGISQAYPGGVSADVHAKLIGAHR